MMVAAYRLPITAPSGPTVTEQWNVGTQPHNGVFANGSFWTAAFDDGKLLQLRLP